MPNYEVWNLEAEDDIAEYCWSNGTILAAREEGRYTIHLYNVHNSYVEIWMDLFKGTVHKTFKSRTTGILSPYLAEAGITISK